MRHILATEHNIELIILLYILRYNTFGFTLELHVFSICPLYITVTFTKSKLSGFLRNIIKRIFCSLKMTNKTVPNEITNTCIIWYDIKVSGIYSNKKDAWHPVSLTMNFPNNFAPREGSFHRICVFFKMILHDNFLYLSIRSDVGKLLFHCFIEWVHFVAKDDVRTAWDRRLSGS